MDTKHDTRDNHASAQRGAQGGFWVNLVRAEVIVQVVWAVVIGAVAITAIIVYGTR